MHINIHLNSLICVKVVLLFGRFGCQCFVFLIFFLLSFTLVFCSFCLLQLQLLFPVFEETGFLGLKFVLHFIIIIKCFGGGRWLLWLTQCLCKWSLYLLMVASLPAQPACKHFCLRCHSSVRTSLWLEEKLQCYNQITAKYPTGATKCTMWSIVENVLKFCFLCGQGGGGRGKYCGRGNPKGSKPPVSPYALPHPHPTMWCFAALLGGGTR